MIYIFGTALALAHPSSLNYPRWDKYEAKTLFWAEEELEAEWESSKTKTFREKTQYETLTGAEDAMAEHDVPLTLSMGEVRDAQTGLVALWIDWYIFACAMNESILSLLAQLYILAGVWQDFRAKVELIQADLLPRMRLRQRSRKFRRTRKRPL